MRLPPLEEVARRWPEIEPILKRATDLTGCYEPIDVLRGVMAGQMGLWIIGDLAGIAVTAIHQYPRKRVLQVPFIAGKGMPRWLPALCAALDAHCRAVGCTIMEGYGRRGWTRMGAGIFAYGTLMYREVPNGQ